MRNKRKERGIDLEMGSFTPLVFGTNGGMQIVPEQPSGQTFPKELRVLCQCHILASLFTEVPPPSEKMRRRDVCDSPSLIVFQFPRNVGESP